MFVTIAFMKCSFCDNLFSANRKDAAFCSAKCRSAAYRQRQRLAVQADQRAQKASATPPRPPRVEDFMGLARRELLREASGTGMHRREPMELQVLRQMPATACGYRLMVPVAGPDSFVESTPSGRAWRVAPFQQPNDPRLISGQHYRIQWYDVGGYEIRPLPNTALPCLYFFLGPADVDATSRSHEELRQLQTVAELRQKVHTLEEDLATARAALLLSRQRRRRLRRTMTKREEALRAQLREGSLSAVVEKWLPIVSAAAVGYVSRATTAARPAAAEPAAAPANDKEKSEVAPAIEQEKPHDPPAPHFGEGMRALEGHVTRIVELLVQAWAQEKQKKAAPIPAGRNRFKPRSPQAAVRQPPAQQPPAQRKEVVATRQAPAPQIPAAMDNPPHEATVRAVQLPAGTSVEALASRAPVWPLADPAHPSAAATHGAADAQPEQSLAPEDSSQTKPPSLSTANGDVPSAPAVSAPDVPQPCVSLEIPHKIDEPAVQWPQATAM